MKYTAHQVLGAANTFQMIVTGPGSEGYVVEVDLGHITTVKPIHELNGGDKSARARGLFILAAGLKWSYDKVDPPRTADSLAELAARIAADWPA